MEPIKRVPLVHQVEERIKDLIKEEKLQPGTKLPTEKELCTNLNVSRGTVREAFRFLQAKGIVELKTGKGAFVAEKKAEKPSPAINWLVANETDLRNVFELRYAIEPIAAKMTAEKIDEEGIICLKNIPKRRPCVWPACFSAMLSALIWRRFWRFFCAMNSISMRFGNSF